MDKGMFIISWSFNFFSSRTYGCSRPQNAAHTRQNSHPIRSTEKCSCSSSRAATTSTAPLSFTPAGCNTGSRPCWSNCSSQESTRLSKETQWYTGVEKDSARHEQYCKIKWAFSAIWYHNKHSGTLNTFIVWLSHCCLIQSPVEIIFTSMPKVSVNKLNLQEEMRALIFSIYHCPWYCNFFTYWLCNIIHVDYSHCKTRLGKFTSDSSSLPIKFFQTNFCAARELNKIRLLYN